MKDAITTVLQQALARCQENGSLPADLEARIQVDHARDKQHGDFATNLALTLAKAARLKPRELAELIVANLPDSAVIEKVEIAGPGFINFYINSETQASVIGSILNQQEKFGLTEIGAGKKIQIEFVSANPTGPLHVGHGRGAAYGAAVANLLKAIGYEVHCEYYVNDAGRQMNILAASVWLRYLELCGEDFPFPVNGYKGDYVLDIAAALHRENGDKMFHSWAEISCNLPKDEPEGDKERYIDAVIEKMKALLHPDQYSLVFDVGLNYILDDIRDDLEHFGVVYDQWFSERSLTDSGDVTLALERLQKSGHCYEKDGAIWFRSSEFGDEKDRVLVRDNGQSTYFSSDIAYHMNKLERGYDRVIDIWGADHHGYVPRVKAALQALGDDPEKLDVLLVQFAVLYRNGKKIPMSTRSGQFVTLRHLRKEIGSDAARFFYVMRKCEQHMDFDLDLAMSQSNENPMYYIQYAHARVCSVFSQLADKGFEFDQGHGLAHVDLLTETHENDLITRLTRYPEVIGKAGQQYEPHQLVHYLRDLANAFHTYYNAHHFIVDDKKIRDARLCLITAARHVIANGLKLLGVSAPEKM